MDGVVISIDTEQGQTVVSTQSATTILTLADLDTMTVKAKISEADVTRVKAGLPTYFTLLGDADTRYYGKLRAIELGPVSSSTSSSSGSSSTSSSSSAVYYYGLFEVPNPDHKLKVSMTAQVAVVINQAKQALCIPVAALGEKHPDGRATVKVLAGGVAQSRSIRTGLSNNVQVQVLEGLRQGEKVVVGDSGSVPKTESSSGPMGPPPGGRH
jgi:macrolide-specific efflux system membrane fusion protein